MAIANRNTRQKRVVWEVIQEAGRPLSPAEVYRDASTSVPSLSLATVYRILKSFTEDGTLVPVSLPGAPDRYETRLCADRHHHHFLCDKCGRVFDIPGCGLKVQQCRLPGFSIRAHEVVLYGICKECGKKAHKPARHR